MDPSIDMQQRLTELEHALSRRFASSTSVAHLADSAGRKRTDAGGGRARVIVQTHRGCRRCGSVPLPDYERMHRPGLVRTLERPLQQCQRMQRRSQPADAL
ncbi:hypothetical protein LMG29739_00242 [Paraburkholderia solisilvae]|uniref:Uncharacterized protein n=1 Tax=Paraburkholderia solisilvae TaxID=624376 RepID=A0A6J5CZW6_9BURK|nr:hypothetical protein LMG29739_00242 [Paraburkholderia solisilvae]